MGTHYRFEDELLEEDALRERVPKRYAQYFDESDFEKFDHRQKDWE